jgi:hypothetical protein
VDWSLFGCARTGHVTYAPDEPGLRDRLMAPAAGGTAWRCLRCGAFVTGGQHGRVRHGSGPAAAAPLLRRGRELRSELILRAFAVDRFLRLLILGAATYRVWRLYPLRRRAQRAAKRQFDWQQPDPDRQEGEEGPERQEDKELPAKLPFLYKAAAAIAAWPEAAKDILSTLLGG